MADSALTSNNETEDYTMDKHTYDAALVALLAIERCVDKAIAQLEALEAEELHTLKKAA